MKSQRKKMKSRASRPSVKQPPPTKQEDENNEDIQVLQTLAEAFSTISMDDMSAFKEANGDPYKAADILSSFADYPPTSSNNSNSGSTSSEVSEVINESSVEDNPVNYGVRAKRAKNSRRFVASTGTVSTVLGKDYLVSSPNKGFSRPKRNWDRPVDKEDAEQFLCSMLGEDSDLNMAVVRDVLCQGDYDVEKALNALLNLAATSFDQSSSGRSYSSSANTEENASSIDNFTDRTSDSASYLSESELQDSIQFMGSDCRSYFGALNSEVHVSTSPANAKPDPSQMVLESLFNISKSIEHEPSTMSWRNVVKKLEVLGHGFDSCSSTIEEPRQNIHASGNEYQVCRTAAKAHWESMRSHYQKAATAYTNGQRHYASYLSEQGKLETTRARKADEKASREIFRARNRGIENVITIDLHGQHVKQAIKLVKTHLLFGIYLPSVKLLRVITGCGAHGVGRSKLKQAVTDLVEKEGIEWREENPGSILIKFNGPREFSFLNSDEDSE
ncbi:protein of unknown function DUF1771 [Dillenia turbinata]|uniref:Smr domain-containing protein n=1 Tax=Dillenia turbinata TaxID=194707 RepID=A0AAN8ZCR3_9MAGN